MHMKHSSFLSHLMHIQHIFDHHMEFGFGDTAGVEMEVVVENAAYLLDAAIGRGAVPLTYLALIERTTNNGDVRRDKRTHIIACTDLYLLFG